MIIRKTAAELEKMRASGLLVHRILKELEGMVKEGVTTLDLEVVAERMIRDAGARAAFKNYYVPAVGQRYKYTLCTSVNDEVVHGQPSMKRVLKKGDIVSIDTGVELNGYFGDSAITVPVGEVPEPVQKLLKVTEAALEEAIGQVRAGNRLFDICGTVERYVTRHGYGIVREYVGHGIGTTLHEEPQVPNYVDPKCNQKLRPGMTLAIEPMVNAGSPAVKTLDDGWTVVTKDGQLSAHFEHTVLITESEPEILTCRAKTPSQLRAG